jgi:uncharacterized membrane protein (Fun14 family)
VSLDSVPSTLFTVGSGGVVRFLIGFALKRIMKILAVIIGLFLGALMYLQSQSVININWDKLYSVSESTLSIIGNPIASTGQVSSIAATLGIPLTEGLSTGFAIGFMKE